MSLMFLFAFQNTLLAASLSQGKQGKAKVETKGSVIDSKIQLRLDRLKIISDGDPFGAGEITFSVTVLHTSPSCPKDGIPPHYRKCVSWRYIKKFKAKSGETKQIEHVLPDNAKYMAVQSMDAVYLFLSVSEKDPLSSHIGSSTAYPDPVTAFTRVNGWGIGSHSAEVNDGIDVGNKRVEVKLHYRIKSWQPDLKLEDFWTVPRVPNPGYEKTKLCIKMSNTGNVVSSSFTPGIYLDNMDRIYYALPRQEGLPPRERKKTYCGMMPTPAEGRHRIAVKLQPYEFDSNTQNNRLEKDLTSHRRLTKNEGWERVWRTVLAFGGQVRDLKAALGFNGASLQRPLEVPSGFNKRKGLKKRPPRPSMATQQEILQMVSDIGKRALRVQDQARMLKGAYQDLHSEGAVEQMEKLIGMAKQNYEWSQHLSKEIKDNNLPNIEYWVGVLEKGYKRMVKQLKLVRKFAGT